MTWRSLRLYVISVYPEAAAEHHTTVASSSSSSSRRRLASRSANTRRAPTFSWGYHESHPTQVLDMKRPIGRFSPSRGGRPVRRCAAARGDARVMRARFETVGDFSLTHPLLASLGDTRGRGRADDLSLASELVATDGSAGDHLARAWPSGRVDGRSRAPTK